MSYKTDGKRVARSTTHLPAIKIFLFVTLWAFAAITALLLFLICEKSTDAAVNAAANISIQQKR